jgi:hypothetical protein
MRKGKAYLKRYHGQILASWGFVLRNGGNGSFKGNDSNHGVSIWERMVMEFYYVVLFYAHVLNFYVVLMVHFTMSRYVWRWKWIQNIMDLLWSYLYAALFWNIPIIIFIKF